MIISTDEDPSLRIESSAIINLRGVSTKLNKYIVFTMQTYKKLIATSCKIFMCVGFHVYPVYIVFRVHDFCSKFPSAKTVELFVGSADLVQKLGLEDQTRGVRKVNKFCHDAAYKLDETAKLMMDTSKLFPKGLNTAKFAIAITAKIDKDTKGNIFTMYSESSTPVLALQVNPFRLVHKDGVVDLDVEEYILGGRLWQTFAIAVNEGFVETLVDCVSVSYKRRKPEFAKYVIKGGQTVLGQQFSGESFKVNVWDGES